MIWAAALAVGAVTFWLLKRKADNIVFRPQKKRWPMKLPFENAAFPAPNGAMITGIYLPAKDKKLTFLFFHGRGGNVSHFEKFALAYALSGYGIFMVDYRGFGLTAGHPSQKHVREDALLAARYLLQTKKLLPQNVVIYGHSLGNAAALHAAAALGKLPWKAVILQSPFLSTPDMAASFAAHAYTPQRRLFRACKAFVTPFLCLNRFDNTTPAARITAPALVCMSQTDATIPWRMSARLADFIPHAKRFLSPRGEHDNFDWPKDAVDRFLNGLHEKIPADQRGKIPSCRIVQKPGEAAVCGGI